MKKIELTPRHREILEYVKTNPGCSTNAVYIATSPVCQRTARRRSMGTYGWSIPATLQYLDLVKITADRSLINKAKAKAERVSGNVYSTHRFRHLVRYHWELTFKGKEALASKPC